MSCYQHESIENHETLGSGEMPIVRSDIHLQRDAYLCVRSFR